MKARLEDGLAHLGAIWDNLRQHADLWREALRTDKARPRPDPLGRAELAFLPAALEITQSPASPAARASALLLSAFFLLALAWASLGDLDIIATASGKLIPSERVKLIQPLETSIVRAVLVSEGQTVRAGQVLVELEVTGGIADVDKLMAELDNAQADMARLEALLLPSPTQSFAPPPGLAKSSIEVQRALLNAQVSEHAAKLNGLEAELARKRAELKTTDAEIARLGAVSEKIRDEAGRRQELANLGYGSQIDRLRAEKEWAENSGQQKVQQSRQVETRAAIASLTAQIAQTREEFRKDANARLAEARAKAATTQQDLIKAADRQRVQSLTAPVDGTVQQIDVHTVGGVVTPAQKLMALVPKGSMLEIEAKLPNKDVGFVEVGQEAIVKVDAFPFTRYGTLKARVETISLDAVKDEESPAKDFIFPLRLSIPDPAITLENGKRVTLGAGMTVSAEIRTGTRKPIEYVLAPLKKYASESGRER